MRITCKDLSYIYNAKSPFCSAALKNVSLEINEEFFGIIGETGSGKSTLVQHFNGLIKPQNANSLFVGEYNLSDKKCDFLSLRRKVGMVFQYPEYQLFAETVYMDVAFGYRNFFREANEAEVEAAVRSALEIVGLDFEKVKNKSPFDLSGGEKRRAAIAGVLVTKPEILILDEPVAGLDPRGKKQLIELLLAIKKDFAKTIIVVSHDMDFVAEYCDRCAVLYKGELKAVGTPKEVFDNPCMKNTGLSSPLVKYLADNLKARGVNIDCDYTTEAFVRAVKEL